MRLIMPVVQKKQRRISRRGSSNEEEGGEEEGVVLEEVSWENVKEMLLLPVDLSQQAQSKLTFQEEGLAVEDSCQ